MSKKALIVVTSVEKYPNAQKATGLWLGQAVHFYDVLHKSGWQIDFVSPKGGYTPIDPLSLQTNVLPIDWQYYSDKQFRNKLANTKLPTDIHAQDYKIIYYAGGHGTIWDFLENQVLQNVSKKIYLNGGYVASVCHGAIGLLNIKDQSGEYLIKGKKVTGFSNQEEDLVGLTNHVPYLTQTQITKRGALYEHGEPFKPFAVIDSRIITGQNPSSGHEVAELFLKSL